MTKELSGYLVRPSLGALLALALPALAAAQGTVTAHKLDVSLKGVGQMMNSSDDLKEDKFSVNAKSLFEICIGRAPSKTEGIYLFLDCANLDDNTIAAIDTEPLAVVQAIGFVDFDLSNLVVTEKAGELTSGKVPGTIVLDCDQVPLTPAADAYGIFEVKFKPLAEEICPDSAKAKVVGHGDLGEEDFILDNGSSITAKKRDDGIPGFPAP